jgi:hypothetical protein
VDKDGELLMTDCRFWSSAVRLGVIGAIVFGVLAFSAGRVGATTAQIVAQEEQLLSLFSEAEGLFASVDQPDSIPLFSDIIATLEVFCSRDQCDQEQTVMLTESLAYRARARFNLGEEDAATTDLRRAITIIPELVLPSEVSPRLLQIFDALRSEMVGYLQIAVSPQNAQIRIDGELIDSFVVSQAMLAGTHAITIERPGYQSIQEEIEVPGGDQVLLDRVLERVSAVYELFTRPPGATVSIDGRVIGSTSGSAPPYFTPSGEAARYRREEFSDALIIENLQPGSHQIEVSLAGYRTFFAPLQVEDLGDYSATVVLDRAQGTLVLVGLPQGASVTVNGEPARPTWPLGQRAAELQDAESAPRLTLTPGEYTVSVSAGTLGVFETTLSLADTQVAEVPISLRAGVTLLGVLGGDRVNARNLTEALTSTLSGLEDWVLVDKSATGVELAEGLDISAPLLREHADLPGVAVDWVGLQAAADRETPGSLYVLGVLSDDTWADAADLWVFPAAPGPARPDRLRVSLTDTAAVELFASNFTSPMPFERPWLGALMIDSMAAAGPLVVNVTEAGPAAAAGLQVGDTIVSIAETAVSSVRDANEVFAAATPGTTLAVQVQRSTGTAILELNLGTSPAVISPSEPGLVYSLISAALSRRLSGGELSGPRWVLEMNRAAVLIHTGAWEAALDALRRIEDAPTGPGLGQAAIDYWLGIALSALGPNYNDSAIQLFQRAAAAPDGRLFHNDGPFVAPRARARLEALGAGGD